MSNEENDFEFTEAEMVVNSAIRRCRVEGTEGVDFDLFAAEMTRALGAWIETAERATQNTAYFRDLCNQIACMVGFKARIDDQGGTSDSPIYDNLPKRVMDLLVALSHIEIQPAELVAGTVLEIKPFDDEKYWSNCTISVVASVPQTNTNHKEWVPINTKIDEHTGKEFPVYGWSPEVTKTEIVREKIYEQTVSKLYLKRVIDAANLRS